MTLLVLGFGVVPVAILMFRQVRSGSWANVDASNRAERPILFKVAGGGLLLLIAVTMALRPASYVLRGSIGVLLMLAVCAVATRWLKVSIHMAFAGLAATTLLIIGSPAGWALAAVTPILGWSRLALGRHGLAEVFAGLLIGIATGCGIGLF